MPDEKGSLAEYMIKRHGISQRQAYKAVSLPRSTGRYKRKPKADEPVMDALNKMVETRPSIGFWQSFKRLRLKGFAWNHKRVYRVYTGLHLNIRRRCKRRLPARAKQALYQPELLVRHGRGPETRPRLRCSLGSARGRGFHGGGAPAIPAGGTTG